MNIVLSIKIGQILNRTLKRALFVLFKNFGGERGIRTLVTLSCKHDFPVEKYSIPTHFIHPILIVKSFNCEDAFAFYAIRLI